MRTLYLILICCIWIGLQNIYSQGSPDYNGGLKFKLDDDGKKYLQEFGLDTLSAKSVLLIEDGLVYEKSTALLKILKDLDGIISYLYIFIYVPKFIRDFFYDIVARSRYLVFGKRQYFLNNYLPIYHIHT